MKKVLVNYGGVILLYLVIFMGIMAIGMNFSSPSKESTNLVVASK